MAAGAAEGEMRNILQRVSNVRGDGTVKCTAAHTHMHSHVQLNVQLAFATFCAKVAKFAKYICILHLSG